MIKDMTVKYARILLFILLSLAVIHAAGAGYASAGDVAVFKERLKNGLTVVIQEEHSAPVVAVQMWVKVGGADESDKEAGISHVFEHMLFKGTSKRKVGELARMVESVGGSINAYTSFDNTVYHLAVPSRHFAIGLDVISDAIQNSKFDPDELAKELEVVLEELKMNEDSPGRNIYKSVLRTAYEVHPYGRPVIGYEDVVKGFTREDILRFFRKWYVPNNMTLVIAGDVDRDEAFRAVKESFREFNKGETRKRKRRAEPEQKGLRTDITHHNIIDTYLGLAYHIPDIKSRDTYALDVLEGVLGSGVTSRLYKALKVDANLMHGFSAYGMSLKDPGIFMVTGTLEAGKTGKAVEEILFQLKRLAAKEPTPEEIERVRLNIESSFIYSKETMQGIASKLGYYESVAGDLSFEAEYLKGIRSVTADDVRRVAAKYLAGENMTVSVLLPEVEKGTVTPEVISGAVKAAALRSAEEQKKFFEAEKDEAATRVRLDNGMTVIVKEVHTNPTVAFYAAFPGGLRFETPKMNGIGNFTAGMLTRGTKTRTREELSTEVQETAGSISGFSGWNSTGVSASFLSRYFDKGLGLFADVIMNADFPEEEIERLRPDIIAAIKRREDNLPSHTFRLLLDAMYDTHPYGMPVSGTEESIVKLKRKDLVRHYNRHFTPERMVLTIIGDVDTEHAVGKIKERFEGFKKGSSRLPSPPKEKRRTGIRTTGDEKDKAQTNIALGFPGTTIGSEDSYPLMVLSEVLSGQGGRLFINLRDKRSLAYSVSSFVKVGVDPGILGLYIASAPEKKDEAIAGLVEELKEIKTNPVTPEELRRAKNSIIGSYEIGLQTPGSQAADMTNHELYGLGYDFQKKYTEKIEAVTAEDVLSVAGKYIDLGAYTLSVVGPNGTKGDKGGSGESRSGGH